MAPIVFYRALLQSSDLAPIDALVASLDRAGLNALPIYVTSLKEPVALETLRTLLDQAPPAIILNLTGFSVVPGRQSDPFAAIGCPVLQVVLSGGTEPAWRDGTRGLSARDIAMQVALPELDGRMLTRAIAFKGVRRRDDATEADEIGYVPVPDRADFVADLAAAWVRLAQTPSAERRVALILANYPNRDGRIGNGVGLDTPASRRGVLRALNERRLSRRQHAARLRGADGGVLGRPDQRFGAHSTRASPTNACSSSTTRRSLAHCPRRCRSK